MAQTPLEIIIEDRGRYQATTTAMRKKKEARTKRWAREIPDGFMDMGMVGSSSLIAFGVPERFG